MAQKFIWPLYFATEALKTERLVLRKGQAFPLQAKSYIRGLGRAYGIPDAETLPFAELPYVAVLNVSNEANARNIMERGLNLGEAKKFMASASEG